MDKCKNKLSKLEHSLLSLVTFSSNVPEGGRSWVPITYHTDKGTVGSLRVRDRHVENNIPTFNRNINL